MNYAQRVTTMRDRGQLTIPQEIRRALAWPDREVVVKVETTTTGFRVERLPISHPQHPVKKLDATEWDHILMDMAKISKKGEQGVNLTMVLREDRDTR